MPKSIKCRRCNKTVEVPDDYEYKTCEICRAKDKADRRVKAEIHKSEKKLKKDLKIDKARMPEILWSYKNYCAFMGQYFHTKPTYEEYEEKVKKWKMEQIELEADIEIAKKKRLKELAEDPWERKGFLGPSRDKMGEWLEKRERGMETVDPEVVQKAMEGPERPVPDEEMSEGDKRIQRFFKEQMSEDEEPEQDSEDLEENQEDSNGEEVVHGEPQQ